MKILVVDDDPTNCRIALAQFDSHDTVVATSYGEGQGLVKESHEFDVVLVDLLMPASGNRYMPFAGKEMPVGIFLALLAAKNGAKHVAVFTDSGHHSHPASACFDAFNPCIGDKHGEHSPTSFAVEGARLLLCNNRNWVCYFRSSDLSTPLDYRDNSWSREEDGLQRGKDWSSLLRHLLSEHP